MRSECKECTKASTANNYRQKHKKRNLFPPMAGIFLENAARLDDIVHIMHEISDKLLAIQELLERQVARVEPSERCGEDI